MKYLLLLLIIASCSSDITSNDNKPANDSTTWLSIKADTSLFTRHFISGLKSMVAEGKFGPAELHQHYLILNYSDTVHFAYELNTDSEYHFAGSNAKGQYHLRIKRLNQVLLQYEAMIIAANDTLYHHKGSAELVTGFFLAVELPEDEETGESFPATEYTDSKNGMNIEISITNTNEPVKIIWSLSKVTNTNLKGYSPTLKMISAASTQ